MIHCPQNDLPPIPLPRPPTFQRSRPLIVEASTLPTRTTHPSRPPWSNHPVVTRPAQLACIAGLFIMTPLPIRHIQQQPQHCLLAATAQIAWALDYQDLAPTYPHTNWDLMPAWAETNLPPAYQRLWQDVLSWNGAVVTEIPAGTGLLVFTRPQGTTHAVSYAAGLIYDPKQPTAEYYSLASYLASTPHQTGGIVYAYPAP